MTEQNEDTAGVIAFPPLLLAGALGAAVLMQLVAPIGVLAPALSAASLAIGVPLAVLAAGLAISGIRAFRAAGTNVEPYKPALVLVHAGPYRFTRNPMYLGLMLLHLAVTVLASLDWGVPALVALALLLHFGVVLREERYLVRRFGQPYRDYLKRTRRWI